MTIANKIIGIDASRWSDYRAQSQGQATGVEIYCRGVILSLIEAAREQQIGVRLYTPVRIVDLPIAIQKIIPGRRLWTLVHLARELKSNPPDIFYTPGYFIPSTAPINSFATVHDVKFKSQPNRYHFKERLWLDFTTKKNLQNARAVITISTESKNEIIEYYHIDPAKIALIPIGYKRWIFGDDLMTRNKTVFFVGRIEKKKSIDVLIKAFAVFAKSHTDWRLLLAGKPGFGYDDFIALARDLNLADKVEFLGYIDDEQKRQQIKSAGIFVHPGQSEGSSIPLFESWDACTPAIVSDSEVMKEIGSKATLYFHAGDSDDLAVKMNELAEDKKLATNLSAEGLKILETMNWHSSGREMIKLMMR